MKRMAFFTFIVIIFFGFVVYESVVPKVPKNVENIVYSLEKEGCSSEAPRDDVLLNSKISNIRKIAELDKRCSSATLFNDVYRISIPSNLEVLKYQKPKILEDLSEYKSYKIKPFIIIEIPANFTASDFAKIKDKTYINYLESLLKDMASNGYDGNYLENMAILYDSNNPNWNKAYISPTDFTMYYNLIADVVAKNLPGVKLGTFLNSSTYENSPVDLGNKDYRSISSYLDALNQVDFIGIIGYPWVPQVGDKRDSQLDPSEYLTPKNVMTSISGKGINTIYFLTGVYVSAYSNDPNHKSQIPVGTRHSILEKDVQVLKTVKNMGYNVNLILYGKDRSADLHEDYSFFGTSASEDETNTLILIDTLKQLRISKIPTFMEF